MLISPHQLVGRERDLSLLRAFLAEAAEDGGALLLSGDAGVGKTALLNVVAAEVRRGGARVLRAAGAEFEAALSFAGLSQLLGPVLGQLSELDEIDRRALRVSLGLIDGTASEGQAVAIATLRLLTALAADQPVLAVVDDVNWLDRASASVLAYVARRVGGARIALIATMRSGNERRLSAAAWIRTSSSRCPTQRRGRCCRRVSRASRCIRAVGCWPRPKVIRSHCLSCRSR